MNPSTSQENNPLPSSAEDQDLRHEVLYLLHSNATIKRSDHKISEFFDECNRDIVSLSYELGNKTKVVFQAVDRSEVIEFSLPVDRRVLSVKLNPSKTILAFHVEKSIIEFINISHTVNPNGTRCYNLNDKGYSQSAKARGGRLLGFIWVSSAELVIITDSTVEYFHVDANRQRLRFIKSHLSATNWFAYHAVSSAAKIHGPVGLYSILIVSTGSVGNSLQPYLFMNRGMAKLQRFEVDCDKRGSGKELFEHSISLASIYNKVRFMVLQHQSLNTKSRGAQILIYTIDYMTGTTSRTHTLDLDLDGKFAINVVDNLVIAHDQPSRSSSIFDIKIQSTEKSDCERHYVPLLKGHIEPADKRNQDPSIELYSPHWVFFQPNYIIDTKRGTLATLHIDLDAIQRQIADDQKALSFLALRNDSESTIIDRVREVVDRCFTQMASDQCSSKNNLAGVSAVFEIVGRLVERPQMTGKHPRSPVDIRDEHLKRIKQEDVCGGVLGQFEPLEEKSLVQLHIISAIVQELILYTRRNYKSVEPCIYEFQLKILLESNKFYQLVQMIRAEIIEDSKQLACLLLSLRDKNRLAARLGIDMLSRLECLGESTANKLESADDSVGSEANVGQVIADLQGGSEIRSSG